ncbi:tail fiber domain-containing protein [Chitinophaga vietnamensis]|uniref:tail fiber domain-containing protein n=1 Tax=Chitinophaga vietnamensis TaxID=2593957 RepID=UPI001178C455|nr:tail fiber domain-containing protein [Chitinophaga vietnamensis]
MKSFITGLLGALLLTNITYAQKLYQIRADTVRIYNVCDTAELVIENHTQGVSGFLFNKGKGRTEFRRVRLQKIGSSQIAITGQDTLDLSTLPGISGIDTIYREGDMLKYVKRNITYSLKAPVATFLDVPWGTSNPVGQYPSQQVTGFAAYTSPDMPLKSEQSLANPTAGNNYYIGHAVVDTGRGYQFAVNWDGEDKGPNGAFIRTKDDTQPAWSSWRELVFKDFADAAYARNANVYTKIALNTPGAATVAWGNIVNAPSEADDLTSVTNRSNQTANKIHVNNIYGPGAPTISLAVGDYDSGINSEGDGSLTLRANGLQVANWQPFSFNFNVDPSVKGNTIWHAGNDASIIRHRGYIDSLSLDNMSGKNGVYGVAYTGYTASLLNFCATGTSTGTFQLWQNYDGALRFRNKTDDRVWNPWKDIWHSGNVTFGTYGPNVALKLDASGQISHRNWIRIPDGFGLYTDGNAYFFNSAPNAWGFRPRTGSSSMLLDIQMPDGNSRGGFYGDIDGNMGIVNAGANGWRFRMDVNSKAYFSGDVSAAGGNFTQAVYAPGFYQSSLRSLKKDIQPFNSNALAILQQAQVRTFRYKADTANYRNIGFIADEVPEEMATPKHDGVNEANTVALLVKAVQELQAENKALKEQMNRLASQIDIIHQQKENSK